MHGSQILNPLEISRVRIQLLEGLPLVLEILALIIYFPYWQLLSGVGMRGAHSTELTKVDSPYV